MKLTGPRTRKHRARSTRWLALVVLAASLLGVLMVRPANSATGSLTLEGEAMTIASDSDTHVFSDASASGGKAIVFPAADTATASVTTTAPTTTVTLHARGDQCQGAPTATVAVDGSTVQTASVAATTWTDYSATVNIPAGTHSVSLTYPNDRFVKGTCDRNLRVDKLTFVYGTGGGGGGDLTPPAPPTGLAATAADSSASLTWAANTESDLAGYNLYRSTTNGGPYSKINGSLLTTRSYSDTGLTNGTTYYYVVKATDTTGNESNPSSQAQATPSAATAVSSFEAESMTIPSGADTRIFSDGTASGGRAIVFPANDSVSKTVTTPAASSVIVRARGDQCNGAPNMLVQVDGATVMSVAVPATSWATYTGARTLAAGSHTVTISFTNDLSVAGTCDRNLRADTVTISSSGGGGTATPLLPDLVQQPPTQLGVAASGASWRLGFNSAVENHGAGPLMVNGHRPDTSSPMVANQAVNMSDGSQQTYPSIGSMIFYVPHNHWHYIGFDHYELRKSSDYSFVAPDQKAGFCLGDRYTPGPNGTRLEPAPVPGPYTNVNCQPGNTAALSVNEGMSVGYGDDYSPQLEGQYIDVTGVAPGQYVVVHRVNQDQSVHESDYSNDAASVLINLWPSGYGVAPYVSVVKSCATSDHCSTVTASKVGRRPVFGPTHPITKPKISPTLIDAPLLVPRSARFFALQTLHRSVHGRADRIRCLRLARARFTCPLTAHLGRVTYRGAIQIKAPPSNTDRWWSYRVRLGAPGHSAVLAAGRISPSRHPFK